MVVKAADAFSEHYATNS